YPDPFTGATGTMQTTAPLTLAEWKRVFGFSVRGVTEDLAAYRQRTGTVVYYNRNELGLGRELGCSEFVDGMKDGQPVKGVACFVVNYGTYFHKETEDLAAAID